MQACAFVLLALNGASIRGDVLDHAWCRTQTPSFTLYSDLKADRAVQLAQDLERFRAAAVHFIPGDRPVEDAASEVSEAPLKVIAFRSEKDFVRVFAHPQIAGFMQPSLHEHLLTFGPDTGGRDIERIAFHEYTHYLIRGRQAINYPIWYEEGFANFLATMRVDYVGQVIVGEAPVRQLRSAAKQRNLRLAQVVDERYSLVWSRHDLPDVYQKAWGFVHFLQHSHLADGSNYSAQLATVLARVDRGESTRSAMESVYGTDLTTLERELNEYLKRRRLPTRRLAVSQASVETTQMCLDKVDVQYVLGEAAVKQNPAFAMKVLRKYLARNPNDIGGLIALSRASAADPGVAYDLARRAIDLDPDSPAANVRMAQLTMLTCTTRRDDFCTRDWQQAAAMYRRALKHSTARVDAAFGLGVVYLHSGQPGDAVNYLKVAYQRAPWAPRINFYLGEAYRLTGDKVKARRHLMKALNWDAKEAWRDRASMALAMIGQ
ncbi:MAG: hypothetical protein O7H39_13750 [Gammaproteobacteria bacterium]|nr:hypothetical protein [Gammaproteobacteria bacterium]